ncbi:MAG: cysteine synthase A [Defluviitaleaceae bacterium]|nr:cysteine synthase A [Defluviitaleaceae bacterium]
MAKIYDNMTDLVGGTPMVRLSRFAPDANIMGKLESYNPAGSVKDRLALAMITDAEKRGLLGENSVIVEPTSGNTGIGLAAVAAARGYRCILTMPETMSVERRKLMEVFGAEVVLTEGAKGMKGAIEKAEKLVQETPGGITLKQFDNAANPAMHRRTTGPEIWEATDGQVDIFVAGAGTGGTITGAGGFLKEKNPNLKIVVVEPQSSPVLSGGAAGPHKIQGIGPGFVPSILNTNVYDEIITVSDDDATQTARGLARIEGLLVGVSAGAAVWASAQIAARAENAGKNIVVIIPDTGERYLSVL